MEYLLILSMLCSDSLNKSACESKFKTCVTWIELQPETKAKKLSKDDIALWLSVDKKARKLCD